MADLATIQATPIKFYDSGPLRSSFSQRVWITLIEKNVDFEHITIDLGNKPEDFKELYASIDPDPTAAAKVPIIIDGGNKLIESRVVSKYLDAKYKSSGHELYPEDPLQLSRVEWFVDRFSETFIPGLFEMLRADSEEALKTSQAKLDSALKNLNKFLEQYGSSNGGEFLLGATYSFAEVAASPFIHRASAALPKLRGYSLHKAIEDQKLTRLEAWIKAALARPSFKETAPSDEIVAEGLKKLTGGFQGRIK